MAGQEQNPNRMNTWNREGTHMIQEAAAFAARAHAGAVRKGTGIPYIYHPMEVALIVAQITSDEELIAAAYLHDVLEDTDVTEAELEKAFGSRILSLVMSETEDKSLSWKERKQATIDHLRTAGREEKILVLGDKLSNMRSTARDYMAEGETVWHRFNEKRRESHQWYLKGILEQLTELQDTMAYRELKNLYEFVYGA